MITALTTFVVLRIPQLSENRSVWPTLAVMIGLIWIGLLGVMFYRRLSRNYQVTTQQLKLRRGIVFRRISQIDMIDIEKVTYRQGPLQTWMDVGTIHLRFNDQPNRTMPGVPRVGHVANLIDQSRRKQRRKHGIPVEKS